MTDRPSAAGPGVDAVLTPYAELRPDLVVAVEDAAGRRVAETSSEVAPGGCIVREIVAGPLAGGRVVAWGPAAQTPLGEAAMGSLAMALGIAHTTGRTGIADVASARRIEQELAHGRRLQRSFVSLVAPEVPGYGIASYYEAAREVGGDFFDLFRMRRRGQPLSIVIADVTGKGIAAALLMAFSRPLLHAAIDNTSGPAMALERTNEVLVRERRSSLFITALCARLDVRTGHLCIANAGHEPPLLVPGDGSPIRPLAGAGPLLGAFDQLDVPEIATDLAPGDLVLFYTDGVTDARSVDESRFDDARLLDTIEGARRGTAQDVVDAISSAVDTFQGPVEPADDITIVAVGRLRSPRPMRSRGAAEPPADRVRRPRSGAG